MREAMSGGLTFDKLTHGCRRPHRIVLAGHHQNWAAYALDRDFGGAYGVCVPERWLEEAAQRQRLFRGHVRRQAAGAGIRHRVAAECPGRRIQRASRPQSTQTRHSARTRPPRSRVPTALRRGTRAHCRATHPSPPPNHRRHQACRATRQLRAPRPPPRFRRVPGAARARRSRPRRVAKPCDANNAAHSPWGPRLPPEPPKTTIPGKRALARWASKDSPRPGPAPP